jgi:glutathione peroxidase
VILGMYAWIQEGSPAEWNQALLYPTLPDLQSHAILPHRKLQTAAPMQFLDLEVTTLEGEHQTLAAYAGKTLLIVNVASRCGFTPQYSGLEALWREYRERGLVVLGFPCNQFGHQEPGSEEEIKAFCSTRYEVSFPMFAKVDVNGPGAHPLFTRLKEAAPGVLGSTAIKWNFTKFLVDKQGQVLKRYGSMDTPASLARDIEAVL